MNDATLSPYPPEPNARVGDPTLTVDTFIAEIPVTADRVILVYLRQHGGRQYVRWRVFHLHRRPQAGRRGWYPDWRRAFVIPVGVAEALAKAIAAAPSGQPETPKPLWLGRRDTTHDAWRLKKLAELGAPSHLMERERRRRLRGPA